MGLCSNRVLTKLLLMTKIKVKKIKLFTKNGQNALEYTLIISVVVAALVAMRVYVQRAVQANLAVIEEEISAR